MNNKKILYLFFCSIFSSYLNACEIDNRKVINFDSKYVFVKGKNNIKVNAKIADTDELRQFGLMKVKNMLKDEGMLFVFEQDGQHCFWMKDTYIPLSIAFIDKNKQIIDIQDMQANSETAHCPSKDIHYTLEMNQGWFNHNNVKINDVLKF